MKRLLLFLILLGGGMSFAQTPIIIGAGTQSGTSSNGATGDPGPMYRSSASSNFVYSRHHYLYTSSELAALPTGAVITEIAWNKDNNAASNANFLFEIYMANSSLTSVQTPPQTWANLTAGSTQVYSSSNTSVSSAIGWVAFPLTTPFVYTGGALEISVNFDMSSGTNPWTTAGFSWVKDPISNRTLSYCGSTASTTLNNARTVRPQIRITYVPGGPCTIPPTAGTATASRTVVCASEPVDFGLTGNSYGQGQTYQWQFSTSPTGPFTDVGSPSNSPAYTHNMTTSGYFRAEVTCGTSSATSSTVQVTVNPNMPGGTYTVDPSLPPSATNFISLEDAVSAISCGISGPVVFDIAPGTYPEQIAIPQVIGASATNRVTFQSATGNPADVLIEFNASGTADNYLVKLEDASYITFRNLTLEALNASYGRIFEIIGSASYDSVLGCVITGPVLNSSSTNAARIYANGVDGKGNVFQDNIVERGAAGFYLYGATSLAEDWVVERNQFLDQYYYPTYLRYSGNLKYRDNLIESSSTSTQYGIYAYYNDNGMEIVGNQIYLGGTGTKYGIYNYYSDGTASEPVITANNIVVVDNGSSTGMPFRLYYSNHQKVYNNTFQVLSTATGSYAGYIYLTSSYGDVTMVNNVFSNPGGGPALYVYDGQLLESINSNFDYNNLYTSGSTLVTQSSNPASSTLAEWREQTGQDMNSIFHDPGFQSLQVPRPDPSNPASWSLNGRGVHIPGNDKDIFGNPRVTQREDGVPDIGAVEFTPTSIPPDAEAFPSSATAGDIQIFTFGEDTVATIYWHPNAPEPNSIVVKPYTGTIAPNITHVSPNSYMYFYADVQVPGSAYMFDLNLYYKDPWLGTINSETDLKMIRQNLPDPWVAYNFDQSTADVDRNTIHVEELDEFGYFTGVDNDMVFSAVLRANPRVFCPGDSVLLRANLGPGYMYTWKRNGVVIPGQSQPTLKVAQSGNYTVSISNATSITVESEPVTINLVSPPGAQVYPQGTTQFCPGDSVTLQANAGGGLSYQWRRDGIDIPGADQSFLDVKDPGVYTVEVRNQACGTVSKAIPITLGPPQVQLGNDTSRCEPDGDPIVLDAGYPGATYLWSTGDTSRTIEVDPSTVEYWVQVNLGPQCSGRDTVAIYLDPLPKIVGISYVRVNPTLFRLSPAGDQHVDRYLWLFSDGSQKSTRTVEHYYNESNKEVKLVVFNDCGSDTAMVILPLQLSELGSQEPEFLLYPNPTQDQLYLEPGQGQSVEEWTIYNAMGAKVSEGKPASRQNRIRIDLPAALPSGNYFLRITDEKGGLHHKSFQVRK